MGAANRIFRPLRDEESAKAAVKGATGTAILIGCANALISALTLAGIQVLPGTNGYGLLLVALLFFVSAWRISKRSRSWSIVGCGILAIDFVGSIAASPFYASALKLLLLIALINGVRGTFAYHRLNKMRPGEAQAAPTGSA